MKKPQILVSLTTDENDFQLEQAAAAQRVAERYGINIEVLYANNDAIQQSQQLLGIIQSPLVCTTASSSSRWVGRGIHRSPGQLLLQESAGLC